jgi:CBS domain-containing protein
VLQRDKWGGALDGKVGDLKIGSEPRTVAYGEEALTALAVMDREQISGTAIVDDAGRLYGSISTSDLKQASETTGARSSSRHTTHDTRHDTHITRHVTDGEGL